MPVDFSSRQQGHADQTNLLNQEDERKAKRKADQRQAELDAFHAAERLRLSQENLDLRRASAGGSGSGGSAKADLEAEVARQGLAKLQRQTAYEITQSTFREVVALDNPRDRIQTLNRIIKNPITAGLWSGLTDSEARSVDLSADSTDRVVLNNLGFTDEMLDDEAIKTAIANDWVAYSKGGETKMTSISQLGREINAGAHMSKTMYDKFINGSGAVFRAVDGHVRADELRKLKLEEDAQRLKEEEFKAKQTKTDKKPGDKAELPETPASKDAAHVVESMAKLDAPDLGLTNGAGEPAKDFLDSDMGNPENRKKARAIMANLKLNANEEKLLEGARKAAVNAKKLVDLSETAINLDTRDTGVFENALLKLGYNFGGKGSKERIAYIAAQNIMILARSGTAVSAEESKRVLAELPSLAKNPTVILKSLDNLLAQIESELTVNDGNEYVRHYRTGAELAKLRGIRAGITDLLDNQLQADKLEDEADGDGSIPARPNQSPADFLKGLRTGVK